MQEGSTVTDKRFLIIASLLLLTWGVLYQDALLAMESIWSRSDTFAHGYFIFPISLWLFWRDKEVLLQAKIKQSWFALPFLLGSLFVGVFSYAVDISVLSQLSAVVSFIAIVWLMLGDKLAWHYKFPLVFLLFSVPMGENLIPWLQDVTAWFTVAFLKINGIPVFRDGLYIQVPTGMFEVAVACSGIRYLIASVAVGTLYAYLTYQKAYKQWLFILFAVALPILANGLRAYGIVAIAYYSDMEYATGADHLIYGWIFFGFVIMIMFWVGGFFADTEQQAKASQIKELSTTEVDFHVAPPMFALSFLFLSYFIVKAIPVIEVAKDHPITANKVSSSWGINFEDALQVIHTQKEQLEFYRAEYANKQTQGELITWKNVTHNPDKWTEVGSEVLQVENKPAQLIHLRSINGSARSYLYQYKIGEHYEISATKTKLLQGWNSLSRQSDYSEIRAVSVVGIQDFNDAKAILKRAFDTAQLEGFSVDIAK